MPYLFTSESVTEGHPDKICDIISDTVLDLYLTQFNESRVACETLATTNKIIISGETRGPKISSDEIEQNVRKQIKNIGYEQEGFHWKNLKFFNYLHEQSADIAQGVDPGGNEKDEGAGDQGIMFGYASDETECCMPLTHLLANKLGKQLTDVRKDGTLWWLRPDGKTQVTIAYDQLEDGSVVPTKVHTVLISTQHAEPSKAKRTEEQDGKDNRPAWTGDEEIAPSMAEMNELIHDHVIVKTLESITLKNGKSALSLYNRDDCHVHLNPSGKFIIGGPQGDAGLTGRKIIIDTYGGWGAHGGGAFSGKDPTKVDRSAAYACRWMAKSIVAAGLCKRALVQLSYAIGVAKPLSLFVETYGTEKAGLTAAAITDIVKLEFDCRPGALARDLRLREPKYNRTAAYCHFGRECVEEDGKKFFSWEDPVDLSKYASMDAAAVANAVTENKEAILKKWVD